MQPGGSIWKTASQGGGAPSVDTDRARRIARAYVENDNSRGIFERAQYYAAAEQGVIETEEAAIDFVLSEAFLELAKEELASIADQWEPYVDTEVRRVLDAGCGPGATTWAMAQRYPKAQVIGVDVEAPALALARFLNGKIERCSFVESPLEAYAPREGFDLIQCREVLEHVFDPARAVERLVSLLRPGGVIYVEAPNYLFPWEPHVKLPMLPRSPKWLLRTECRLTGRDPDFVAHLNLYCSPRRVRHWIMSADPEVHVIDLMAAKVETVLALTERPRVTSRAILVKRLSRLPGALRTVGWVLRRVPIAPSVMVLVVRPRVTRSPV